MTDPEDESADDDTDSPSGSTDAGRSRDVTRVTSVGTDVNLQRSDTLDRSVELSDETRRRLRRELQDVRDTVKDFEYEITEAGGGYHAHVEVPADDATRLERALSEATDGLAVTVDLAVEAVGDDEDDATDE